jgi:hypothetical protein
MLPGSLLLLVTIIIFVVIIISPPSIIQKSNQNLGQDIICACLLGLACFHVPALIAASMLSHTNCKKTFHASSLNPLKMALALAAEAAAPLLPPSPPPPPPVVVVALLSTRGG